MHTAYIQPPGAPPVKVCYIVTYKSCHILGALLQTYRIFGFILVVIFTKIKNGFTCWLTRLLKQKLTLICTEALQNQWCFRGFFHFCHHLHLEPRVMHCQLPATLDFSLWPLLVPIINREYLFGLSTSPTTLFC